MAPTQDTFADRCKAVRQFVSDYTDARIESPHQYDDSELPAMYDDYRTRAEIAVVHSAVERGVIPDALDTQNQLGPKPIDTYAVQIHVEEWQRSADLERDLLALSGLRDAFPTVEGDTVTKEVVVELQADVRKGGESIGTATAKRRFPLTLGHEAAQASIGMAVDGDVVLK